MKVLQKEMLTLPENMSRLNLTLTLTVGLAISIYMFIILFEESRNIFKSVLHKYQNKAVQPTPEI